jgi:hypothetical protein
VAFPGADDASEAVAAAVRAALPVCAELALNETLLTWDEVPRPSLPSQAPSTRSLLA